MLAGEAVCRLVDEHGGEGGPTGRCRSTGSPRRCSASSLLRQQLRLCRPRRRTTGRADIRSRLLPSRLGPTSGGRSRWERSHQLVHGDAQGLGCRVEVGRRAAERRVELCDRDSERFRRLGEIGRSTLRGGAAVCRRRSALLTSLSRRPCRTLASDSATIVYRGCRGARGGLSATGAEHQCSGKGKGKDRLLQQ